MTSNPRWKTAMASLALAFTSSALLAQTFPTLSTMPKLVDDGQTGDGVACISPGPIYVEFAVSGVTAPLTAIAVNVNLNAPWAGDVVVTLHPPAGPGVPLFGRIGKTAASPLGDSSNLNGTYQFVDPAVSANNIWTAAAALDGSGVIPPGTYATTQVGSASTPNPAPTTALLAAFSSLTPAQINGDWSMGIQDCAVGDRVTVNSAEIVLNAAPPAAGGTALAVPTMGQWGVLLLGLMAAGLGALRLRRRCDAT